MIDVFFSNNFHFILVSGWRCLGTKCYQFFNQYVIRGDAAARCLAKGATLARIRNRQENDFIWRMLAGDIWIGLNDIAEASMSVVSFIGIKAVS